MKKKPEQRVELVASNAEADVASQVAEIVSKVPGTEYGWLLVTQQYDFPCEGRIHATRDGLIGDLGDALATSCYPVAIYHNGHELTEDEGKVLQSEAIEGLGPISRAKAEGRFP